MMEIMGSWKEGVKQPAEWLAHGKLWISGETTYLTQTKTHHAHYSENFTNTYGMIWKLVI